MMILLIMLKTSFVLIAFIAFLRRINLTPAWVVQSFICALHRVSSRNDKCTWALEPLEATVLFALGSGSIWSCHPSHSAGDAAGIHHIDSAIAADAPVVSPFARHIIRLTRREGLIDLAIVVSLRWHETEVRRRGLSHVFWNAGLSQCARDLGFVKERANAGTEGLRHLPAACRFVRAVPFRAGSALAPSTTKTVCDLCAPL
jgi:hypothetical protein